MTFLPTLVIKITFAVRHGSRICANDNSSAEQGGAVKLIPPVAEMLERCHPAPETYYILGNKP